MPLKAHRFTGCDSDRCDDCPRYGDHCDGCGRRVCKLASVSSPNDELLCLDCARDALLFCLANKIDPTPYEEQVTELERHEIVRVGPLRGPI